MYPYLNSSGGPGLFGLHPQKGFTILALFKLREGVKKNQGSQNIKNIQHARQKKMPKIFNMP